MTGRRAATILLALLAWTALVHPPVSAGAQDVEELKKMMLRPLTEQEQDPIPPVPVVTRGWANKKFGRIVFDWDEPVGFNAKIVGDQLRITFDKPLKTKLQDAAKILSRFLSELQVSANERTVSGNLTGFYSVQSFSNENAVVIDLIPEPRPVGEPDEDPDAWLRKLPIIPVRAGEHPGFGRLVFDWDGDVSYDLEKEGKFVRLRFDRPARIDLSRIVAALPGRVQATTSETKKSEVYVALMVPPAAEIRHFRDGVKIAVDIIAPAPPKPEPKPEKKVAETEEQRKARTSTKAIASKEGHDDAGKPLSLSKMQVRARRAAELDRQESAKRFKDAPLVTLDADRRGPALDVKFNWRKPVSAAMYRRGDYIWVMFNQKARLSLGSLSIIGEGLIDDVEQTDAADFSLMKFRVPPHIIPTVKLNGTIWSLRLAPARMTGPIAKPLQIVSETDREGRSTLLLGARGLNRPHVFRDRIIGDVIHVYTVPHPGIGNRNARRLVDIEVLASGVGMAVVPRRDDIRLVRSSAGLHVSTPDGLHVSRPDDQPGAAVATKSEHLFGDMADWSGGAAENFEKTKHLHLRRIVVAPKGQRNNARLNLARFYVANGMAADAMGVLEVIVKHDPSLKDAIELRALRGAAHYLLGHYANAALEFNHPDIKSDPSISPWRAGIAAARGDWLSAYQVIKDTRSIVSTAPGWLRTRFQLIAAEAALVVKDIDTAKPWLDGLRTSPLTRSNQQYLNYLNGHAMKLEGKYAVARNIWRGLAEDSARLVQAKSRFALINTDVETTSIQLDEAARKLEALAFSWRGDAFEFDLNRRLGDVYADMGDYRASLTRLRSAASHFKDVEGAEAIAEDMRKRFRKLFLEGGADKLEPVRALALYEEFRELTPAGADGDEMIRILADRLVKVDLLSEASTLLDRQVRFRLTGLDRSRVGARLALIHMFNREPEKALEALKLSESDELPTELEVQRRYLSVRARGATGDLPGALEILEGDVSHHAELLRLELHWGASDWVNVAKTIRRIIPQQTVDILTPERADLVLRWAVALTMQSDTDGLLALRDRFGPAMDKTRFNDAFKAIAGVDIGKVPDFKTLVDKTADLGDFRSFMAGYQKKIKSHALSAIN